MFNGAKVKKPCHEKEVILICLYILLKINTSNLFWMQYYSIYLLYISRFSEEVKAMIYQAKIDSKYTLDFRFFIFWHNLGAFRCGHTA